MRILRAFERVAVWCEAAEQVWYHASPHRLSPGSLLTPENKEKNWQWQSPYDADPERSSHVWVEKDPERAGYWARGLNETDPQHRPTYIYKVRPHAEPQQHSEGWMAPSAEVIGIHDWGWPYHEHVPAKDFKSTV